MELDLITNESDFNLIQKALKLIKKLQKKLQLKEWLWVTRNLNVFKVH